MVSIGRGAERVAGVHAHGVDVLDEADGDHLVLGVADDLQLQLLPAQHRLLDQDLARSGWRRCRGWRRCAAPRRCRPARRRCRPWCRPGGRPPGSPARRRSSRPPRRCRPVSLWGMSMPSCFIVSLKAMRSSPRSMASTLHADDLHAVLLQHAGLGQLGARGSGPVWPPRLGSSASGRSFSMISRHALRR